jgi:SagB-type dehydrogenase family enzyme
MSKGVDFELQECEYPLRINMSVLNKSKKSPFLLAMVMLCIMAEFALSQEKGMIQTMTEYESETIRLPEPVQESDTSIEEALLKRRSVRSYKDRPLALAEISQLLWAAQGITSPRGLRAAPSAGALYPLKLYVIAGNVDGLQDGVYNYRPYRHELVMVVKGDKRTELRNAALGQTSVSNAAAVIVFAAVYERTTVKYGDRGIQYVHIEAGHAAQNVFLQAVPLALGTVVIGAFHDDAVKEVLKMSEREEPLYIMPVGRMK